MTKAEKRMQTIGEIYEALDSLAIWKRFTVVERTDGKVIVFFSAEDGLRFGLWDPKEKRFSQVHEKYQYLYKTIPESRRRVLEPIAQENSYIDKVKEANQLLGELIPQLVKLGLMLCELRKGEKMKEDGKNV